MHNDSAEEFIVMAQKPVLGSKQRLMVLRQLLSEGTASTQEELVDELSRRRFSVTQSTISRDLRRIGAIKVIDSKGQTVYRMNDGNMMSSPMDRMDSHDLVIRVQHNGYMIVIKTTPGSASLVARILDQAKPAGIMGTIAGDDTVFVAPVRVDKIGSIVEGVSRALNYTSIE